MRGTGLVALGSIGIIVAVGCTGEDPPIGSIAPPSGLDGGSINDGRDASAPNDFPITPVEVKVGRLRRQNFSASIDVTWSIEVEGGGTTDATIDATGGFVAPKAVPSPAVMRVVATSKVDPTKQARSTVTIVDLRINLVAGVVGGPGNVDDDALRSHFEEPRGYCEFTGVGGGTTIAIAEAQGERVRIKDPNSPTFRTLVDSHPLDGGVPAAEFSRPRDIVCRAAGSPQLFLNDQLNGCIRAVDPVSGVVKPLAGTCGAPGYGSKLIGTVTSMDLDSASGLASDNFHSGHWLYFCDIGYTSSFTGIRRVNVDPPYTDTESRVIEDVVKFPVGGDCTMAVSGGGPGGRVMFTGRTPGVIEALRQNATATPTDVNAPDFAPENNVNLPAGISKVSSIYGDGGQGLYVVPDTDGSVIYRYGDGVWATPWSGVDGVRRVVNGSPPDARFVGIGSLVRRQTAFVAVDSAAHAIREIDGNNGTVRTAFGAALSPELADGPSTDAHFTTPAGIAVDDAGNIYVADVGFERPESNVIRKVDVLTKQVTTFSGTPHASGKTSVVTPANGPATSARFRFPVDIVYAKQKLWVLDLFANAIRTVNVETGEVATEIGQLDKPGNTLGTGAQALLSLFNGDDEDDRSPVPQMTTDGANIYFTELGNKDVKKIDLTTNEVSLIADGFDHPSGIAYENGALYVSDARNLTISKIDLGTKAVTRFLGQSGTPVLPVDGDYTTARLFPGHLAADGLGHLFLSESFLNTPLAAIVRLIDIKAQTIESFAGHLARTGFLDAPLPANLNCVLGLQFDKKGDLYFVDGCDHVVGAIQAL